MNLEVWAFETIRDGAISEQEFAAELPRLGRLLDFYPAKWLSQTLAEMTLRGHRFWRVLDWLEAIMDVCREKNIEIPSKTP